MEEILNRMGCDIFSWVEVYNTETDTWTAVREAFPADAFEREHYRIDFVSSPFRVRDYGLFGFLAGVRNYVCCEPLAAPRGLPIGCDKAGGCSANDIDELTGLHSCSWFMLWELLGFDYEKVFWNRRVHKDRDGTALAEEGEGIHQTYREFLGPRYFDVLENMRQLGEPNRVRVIFCFGD